MGKNGISEEEEGSLRGGNEPLERPRCVEWTAPERSSRGSPGWTGQIPRGEPGLPDLAV